MIAALFLFHVFLFFFVYIKVQKFIFGNRENYNDASEHFRRFHFCIGANEDYCRRARRALSLHIICTILIVSAIFWFVIELGEMIGIL